MFNDLQLPGGKAGLLKEPRSNCQFGAQLRRGSGAQGMEGKGGGGKLDREKGKDGGWLDPLPPQPLSSLLRKL